jgi:TPR repeat protein
MKARRFTMIWLCGWLLALWPAGPASAQENIKELETAAKKDPQAMYKMGWFYSVGYDNKVKANYSTAESWFKKAAAAGVPEAQYKLGYMYDPMMPVFKPVKKDYRSAVEWYVKADAGGIAAASYALAQWYKNPTNSNYGQHIPLIQKAAKQGLAAAQSEIATAHYLGMGGVPKDYSLSLAWARLAAEQGDRGAILLCQDIEASTKSGPIKADLAKTEVFVEQIRREIAGNLKP